METEEETTSTSSGSSEKSSSAKVVESESPEVTISPDQSNHSKPDRTSDSEPPCKMQKKDLSPEILKDSGTSSGSLKEEGTTSESPNTEDEVPMEVDEQLPSDQKPEVPDSVTSDENLKGQDPAICEPDSTLGEPVKEQDLSVADDTEKPRTPSPLMDVSCQSETSDVTSITKSVTLIEDTEVHSSSTLASEVSNKPGTSDKHLIKQDAIDTMDEDETSPSSIQPEIPSKPETDESLRAIDLTTSSDKVSPSLQSDFSNEPGRSETLETQNQSCESKDLMEVRQSSETLETQNQSCESKDLMEVGQSSETLEIKGPLTMESTETSTIQPEISSEPGPSGESLKKTQNQSCLESSMLSEPGPSGLNLRARGPTVEGAKLTLSSFNLDKGVIGNQSLDRETCENIQAELDPRITSKHILSCFKRLRDSYVKQRKKQEDESKERQLRGGYSYEQIEGLENKDEISIRSWLKYSLPREADYLNSIAGLDDSVPDPPDMEDDRTYSLSSGEIPVEDRVKWRRGIALGERLLRQAKLHEDCTPFGRHSRPNREYDIEARLTSDLMNLLNDLARRISDEPCEPIPTPPDDVDSGNVSPGSIYLRTLPSIQEDDTSLGAETFRSEEAAGAASMRLDEELGAASSLRSSDTRPISDQVARLLAEESCDSESSDSSTPYPKSIDTSEYQIASSVLDCSSLKEDVSEATTISTAENPREDQVASGLAEVHIDNDDTASVSGLEVNLENDESESTPYPATEETESDGWC